MVASVPFSFDVMLISADQNSDLIVLVDTLSAPSFSKSATRVRHRLEALGQALDVIGSKRVLTAVFVGLRPAPDTVDRVSKVARVLQTDGAPGNIRADLAILLPLDLPDVQTQIANPFNEVYATLSPNDDAGTDRAVQAIVEASAGGATSVEKTLIREIERSMKMTRA